MVGGGKYAGYKHFLPFPQCFQKFFSRDQQNSGLFGTNLNRFCFELKVNRITKKICETSKSVTALGKKTFYTQINLDRRQAYR